MAQSHKELKNLEQQFLKVTFVFVTLLSIPTTWSIVSEPQKEQNQATQGRQPASVGPTESATEAVKALGQNVTADLGCNYELPESIDATHLRLVRSKCGQGASLKELEITNITNGFTASVVFLKQEKVTTDYIDLADGENLFLIKGTAADGSTFEKKLTIQRRSPASTKN
ncbi:MAG: hypothetical protein LW875_04385 [Proteobacteria bacterium]|jgi:hypothetical protein|nr:hypothetical protein [Pseudomonadota bacterium]